jgi:pimeloyl-ACP methyl ester carboxylesterase
MASHRDYETTTSADGTRLAYDVRGDGPPLVYVTGAICHRRFGPVASGAKTLSTAFRVLTYDRRGRGDSGDNPPWSMEREVEDISALIDELGGSALLYGHSSGAVLAMHVAHRLSGQVQRVALYDASWAADDAEAATYADLRTEVDEQLARGRNGRALQRFLIGIGMPRTFATLLPLMPGWRRMRALAPTLRYDMALTAQPPPLATASEVTVPTHVIVGQRSPQELHRVAGALSDAIPGATHEVLPGQDHMVSQKVLLPSLVRALCPDQVPT